MTDDGIYEDSIGLWMKAVGEIPLLSDEEEVRLARLIARGQQAAKELDNAPRELDAAHHAELEAEIKAGEKAREQFILANTRLVVSVAKKYRGHGVPFLDLIQEGNLGLMRAVEKYDAELGYRFSTYATWWIRQAVTRAITDYSRTIRLPVHVHDKWNKIRRTRERLMQENGGKVTDDELADEMGLSMKSFARLEAAARVGRPVSLDAPQGEDGNGSLADTIFDDGDSPEELADLALLRGEVTALLDTLTPRLAKVLRLRFGLGNEQSHTLEQAGKRLGVTRERVRQLESMALRKLRHASRSRRLRGFK